MRDAPPLLGPLFWSLIAPAVLVAQDAPPTDDELLEHQIVSACGRLREAGRLVECSVLVAEAKSTKPRPSPAAAARSRPLPPADLCASLRESLRLVGHFYRCTECEEWHFNSASGFVVGKDGLVATCHHVIAPDEDMREAFLVVADLQGNVWPVEHVAAADAGGDVCVLATPGRDWAPLPLAASVRQGERIWCLSNPDHQFGFFSEGLVARRYLQRDPPPEGQKPQAPETVPARPWLHVTCDFAKGSSGAPIVDATGTVVGIAQSTTTVVYDETADLVDTQMVFKTATPASVLASLLPPPPAPAPSPSTPPSPEKAPEAGKTPK